MMTKERLQAIQEITDAATAPHGCLRWGPMTADDGNLMDADQVADWVQLALAHGSGPAYAITVERSPAHDDGRQATVALMGNGPTSAANARFWVMARTDIPDLLAEIARLRECVRVRDAVIRPYKGCEDDDCQTCRQVQCTVRDIPLEAP